MPRYIDADDALKLQIDDNTGDRFALGWNRAIAKVTTEIPSADVAPVVHAKWVSLAYDFLGGTFVYACTRCDRHIKVYHREDLKDFLYCHCGAKMYEKENEK